MSEKKYSISVVLPTRGRTDALTRSVIGLVNRAINLDSIQLMFAFDNDDAVGQEHFINHIQPWLDDKGVDYLAMEFDPLGYGRLNEYINTMALQSSGDWIFFWNDDAIMETTGWDKIITNYTGQFKLLAVHTHRDHPYSIFPIVPRAWLDVLGYLSPHPLTDAWLSQIAYKLDIWERIDVWVTHDRHDLTGNNNDETFQNREIFEGKPSNPKDYHNPMWIKLRIQEAEKLAAWMESSGIDTTWWKNVAAGKQDPWVKLVENDPNGQMKQFSLKLTV